MLELINRIFISLYALTRNILNRLSVQPENRKVLIIFQQVFGDSVILLPALEGYVELFHNRRGYQVTMICRPSINKFLHDIAELPKHLNIEIVDFKRLVNDFKYFKEVSKKYDKFAEITVVTGTSLSAELLSTTLCSKERHGLISCYRIKWPLPMALFQRLAYTDIVIPPVGMMMIQRHRLMLNHLGLTDYKGQLSSLKPQNKIIAGRYCVICPGASTTVKCWPIDRFGEIADWVIDTYDMDVHLCGGAFESKTSEQLENIVKCRKRIYNHVGKTSFNEWSSIVQHAVLVIGNDSATLHIAAATHRKCICITGVYDKFQFFPYLVDELKENESLPVTVIKEKSCAYCRTKGYFAGYGNIKCKASIRQGNCALCIAEITVDEIKKAVTSLL
ncbi:glycosyltransferase family 9 protein [Phocaeicola sp.]